MASKISKRLLEIVEALPIYNGMRVLEIGCGPGVAARELVHRFENIYVLAIDRSRKAIEQAVKNSKSEIENGKLNYLQVKIEDFELDINAALFDIAFAIRVGAIDGRHPEIHKISLDKIKRALKRNGKLFIDGGNPLKEVKLNS